VYIKDIQLCFKLLVDVKSNLISYLYLDVKSNLISYLYQQHFDMT